MPAPSSAVARPRTRRARRWIACESAASASNTSENSPDAAIRSPLPFAAPRAASRSDAAPLAHLRAHELREREPEREHEQRDRERRARARRRARAARAPRLIDERAEDHRHEHERRDEQAQRPRERQRARDLRAVRERYARGERVGHRRHHARGEQRVRGGREQAERGERDQAIGDVRRPARRAAARPGSRATRTASRPRTSPRAKRPAHAVRAIERLARVAIRGAEVGERAARARPRDRGAEREADESVQREPQQRERRRRARPARARATPRANTSNVPSVVDALTRTAGTGSVPLVTARKSAASLRIISAFPCIDWRTAGIGGSRAVSGRAGAERARLRDGSVGRDRRERELHRRLHVALDPICWFMNADWGSSAPLRRSR